MSGRKSKSASTVMTSGALAVSAVLFISGGAGSQAGAAPNKAPYAIMAPIAEYLSSDPADEIAQARTAAPPSISDAAEIMTLDAHGYQTAEKGKNGFVCLVQRAWFSNLGAVEFWNPKLRAPICFNPQGARSVLPLFLERTRWAMGGMSQAEMTDRTKAEIAAHAIPAPEIGTLTYMMAKGAYLGDAAGGPWRPHLMFFLPRMAAADWGADLPASPVNAAANGVEPFTTFYVPVAKWSDGTPDSRPPAM